MKVVSGAFNGDTMCHNSYPCKRVARQTASAKWINVTHGEFCIIQKSQDYYVCLNNEHFTTTHPLFKQSCFSKYFPQLYFLLRFKAFSLKKQVSYTSLKQLSFLTCNIANFVCFFCASNQNSRPLLVLKRSWHTALRYSRLSNGMRRTHSHDWQEFKPCSLHYSLHAFCCWTVNPVLGEADGAERRKCIPYTSRCRWACCCKRQSCRLACYLRVLTPRTLPENLGRVPGLIICLPPYL